MTDGKYKYSHGLWECVASSLRPLPRLSSSFSPYLVPSDRTPARNHPWICQSPLLSPQNPSSRPAPPQLNDRCPWMLWFWWPWKELQPQTEMQIRWKLCCNLEKVETNGNYHAQTALTTTKGDPCAATHALLNKKLHQREQERGVINIWVTQIVQICRNLI